MGIKIAFISDKKVKFSSRFACIYRYTFLVRKKWGDNEVAAIRKHLDTFLKSGKVPRMCDAELALEEPALINRTWRDVKNYVHNFNQAQKRKVRDMST